MDLVTLRSQQGAGMGNLPNPVHSNNVEVHVAIWRHNFEFEVHGGKPKYPNHGSGLDK